MMTKNRISRRVVRIAVAKELFSSPMVGKWPLYASIKSQSHFGISMTKLGLSQLGSEIKTGSPWKDKHIFTCASSCSPHVIRR